MHGNHDRAAVVVVNKGGPNGIGVVRGFGRRGIPVISVDSDRKNITFFSRYATRRIYRDIGQENDVIQHLTRLGRQFSIKPVLIVTGDEQLLVVLKHKSELEEYYHCPMAELDVAVNLVNKKMFYQTLDRHGLPHAETQFPESVSEVQSISRYLDYPYLVKPVYSHSFKKKFRTNCFKAESSEELVELYGKVSGAGEETILQKVIPGDERYLVYTYFNRDSKPMAVCCYKKIRIFPTDFGNACVCQTEWNAEAVRLSLDTLKAIGYYGIAEAELQRDALDGELKLVEINARTTVQNRLSAKCGIDMEYVAYLDALGNSTEKSESQKEGVKWFRTFKDLSAVFSSSGYLATGEITLGGWIDSLRGEKEYAIFAWDDPVPFVVMSFQFFAPYVFRLRTYKKVCSLLGAKLLRRHLN